MSTRNLLKKAGAILSATCLLMPLNAAAKGPKANHVFKSRKQCPASADYRIVAAKGWKVVKKGKKIASSLHKVTHGGKNRGHFGRCFYRNKLAVEAPICGKDYGLLAGSLRSKVLTCSSYFKKYNPMFKTATDARKAAHKSCIGSFGTGLNAKSVSFQININTGRLGMTYSCNRI